MFSFYFLVLSFSNNNLNINVDFQLVSSKDIQTDYQEIITNRIENLFAFFEVAFLQINSENVNGDAVYIDSNQGSSFANCGFFFCCVQNGNGGGVYVFSNQIAFVST
jgi:hypothetical protein